MSFQRKQARGPATRVIMALALWFGYKWWSARQVVAQLPALKPQGAMLVDGFKVDGFWTALWASLFIALLSLVLGTFVLGGTPEYSIQTSPGPGSVWL